tara:strand:+ start:43 stop:1461 length:1419 start_codon:yes stop_codon:yes gene_type:complete
MISSFRNFAKTKFAGLLVFIMIIPFVFWGMGSMFSDGNTNNLAKINKTNISTQEFIDYLNGTGIPQETIRNKLNDNIIEELLSSLISNTLLDLEIKDFNLIISENILRKKIKENKNFFDEDGNFQRLNYEKFLLENNQTAPMFELRLKQRELQKNLFDLIGSGTVSPIFLVKKLYEEENKKIELNYFNLNNFYLKKEDINEKDLLEFIEENKEQLKLEYLDFSYAVLNPENLIGTNEFSQSFFDQIDQIEMDISNELPLETILSRLNINPININNFRFSENKGEIEKRIFELRENSYDIFENNDDYVIYNIKNIRKKNPELSDEIIRNEIASLFIQKKKFEYNKDLLDKIRNKEFTKKNFLEMGKNLIESKKINSIKDNKKFEINSVEMLYSLPQGTITLINDDKNNIYLAQIKKFENVSINITSEEFKKYISMHNSTNKNTLLKSYDLFLNKKYNVVLNEKTIERVKNFFQ